MGTRTKYRWGAVALAALPATMAVAAHHSKTTLVTPVVLVTHSAEHLGASLSAVPAQNPAADWAASLYVPEFVGTLGGAAMLIWALRSRRII